MKARITEKPVQSHLSVETYLKIREAFFEMLIQDTEAFNPASIVTGDCIIDDVNVKVFGKLLNK